MIPALGIEKMLDRACRRRPSISVAPGVKTQDLDNLFGALDRAIPGLGKVVQAERQCRRRRRHQLDRSGGNAGRQEGALLSRCDSSMAQCFSGR